MKVKSVFLMVLCTLFSISSFAQQKDYYELLQSIESKMDRLNRLIIESRRHEKLSLLKLEQLDASLEQAWFSFSRSNNHGPGPQPGHNPGHNPGHHNPIPPINPPGQPPMTICPDIQVGSTILTTVQSQRTTSMGNDRVFVTIQSVDQSCYASGYVNNQYVTVDLLRPIAPILMATDNAFDQQAQIIAARCSGHMVGQRMKMRVNGRNRNVTITKIAEDCTVEVKSRGQLMITRL